MTHKTLHLVLEILFRLQFWKLYAKVFKEESHLIWCQFTSLHTSSALFGCWPQNIWLYSVYILSLSVSILSDSYFTISFHSFPLTAILPFSFFTLCKVSLAHFNSNNDLPNSAESTLAKYWACFSLLAWREGTSKIHNCLIILCQLEFLFQTVFGHILIW